MMREGVSEVGEAMARGSIPQATKAAPALKVQISGLGGTAPDVISTTTGPSIEASCSLSKLIQGSCFVAGTEVATANGGQAIDTLVVGERVDTPDGSLGSTDVDPASWRKITLRMANPDCPGDTVRITTLRSEQWIKQSACAEGARVWLEFEELKIADWADVESIEPCPELESGPGRVVLTTINRLNPSVMEVKLAGSGERFRPTQSHPLFSATRNNWVATVDLRPGEQLRTSNGVETVESITAVAGSFRVYNIEVENEHCYFAGDSAVLSHNTCGTPLLSGEGAVGTYDVLIKAGTKGDNITPHHIPSANHMAQHGISKGQGIAINMEQPFPGTGGRHRATFTYGTQADVSLTPRQALGQGIWDARRIYQQDGLYGPEIRSALQDVIRQNRAANPGLFDK